MSAAALTDQRQVTAEHEAAHTMAYRAFGYPIHRVSIEPEAFTQSTARPVARPLRDMGVITAAGLVIEARYGALSLAEQLEETIALVAEGWLPGELGDLGFFAEHSWLLESSLREAEALLIEHRAYHERVTEALLARGTLTACTLPCFVASKGQDS